MPDTQQKCPLCGENAQCEPSGHRDINLYKECACGAYYAHEVALAMAADDIDAGRYKHLPALLYERTLRSGSVPLVVFQQSHLRDAKENVTFTDSISANDLLAQWPETVPERIDRCLCNLANYKKEAGEIIELKILKDKRTHVLLFSETYVEARYYLKALVDYGWVSDDLSDMQALLLVITPEGWGRVRELTGGAERHRNPAFVAMWFGKKPGVDRAGDMSDLFDKVIKPACSAAGFLAKRSDSEDHNDFIMGKIIEDIRQAPFVIAELTENSSGVYFEAGFAKGRGIDVIYCTPSAKDVHFDVRGVNLLEWGEDREFFRRRLGSWILGTVGHGPHKFDVEGE